MSLNVAVANKKRKGGSNTSFHSLKGFKLRFDGSKVLIVRNKSKEPSKESEKATPSSVDSVSNKIS